MTSTKLVEFESNRPIEFKDLEEILNYINRLSLDADVGDEIGNSGFSQISEFCLNRALTKLTVEFESNEDKYTILDWAKVNHLGYNFLLYNPDTRRVVNGNSEVEAQLVTKRRASQEDQSTVIPRPRLFSHSEDDECVGKFMGILNKLTESNFHKMLAQIASMPISTESVLERVVDNFYKKITSERAFVRLYANLCKSMWFMKVPSDSNPSQHKHFRHMFLMKCQSGFERGYTQDPDYLELVEGI